MRNKVKSIFKLFLAAMLVIGAFGIRSEQNQVLADNSDFEANYEYYCELCSTKSSLTDAERQLCTEFREYEMQRASELQDLIDEATTNLEEMRANIALQGEKIAQLNSQISILQNQIDAINATITIIEGNIESLQIQIDERELKIETLNTQIKERMQASQSNVRTNSYIKFIMGADSFVDMLRRISAINEITSYDMGKIDEMEAEKVLLKEDMDEMQSQKDNLVEEQNTLEVRRQSYQSLLTIAQELMDEFRRQESEFEDRMAELEKDKSELDRNIDRINQALNDLYSSNGFGQFFRNTTFYISTEAFYYTGGGFHAALDAAVANGTNLYAIANGVVVDTGTGCAYNGGYMGNTCNWGRGNYIFYFCLIGDRYYFVQCDHLTSVDVSIGDTIYQGNYIGTTGNSGNSSGPHLHLAVYYLGTTSTTSPSQILEQFRIYDNRFGLANNIYSSCEYRGWNAPCFMNPNTEIYGYRYGNWYTVY